MARRYPRGTSSRPTTTSDTRFEYMSARNCAISSRLSCDRSERRAAFCVAARAGNRGRAGVLPRSLGWRIVVPVGGGRTLRGIVAGPDEAVLRAPFAQARDDFTLDGEVAQQVVEFHGERQEVVARQGLFVAQLLSAASKRSARSHTDCSGRRSARA